jgi:hypothetical protein
MHLRELSAEEPQRGLGGGHRNVELMFSEDEASKATGTDMFVLMRMLVWL